jgi:iron complex transport system substrate-binding protein
MVAHARLRFVTLSFALFSVAAFGCTRSAPQARTQNPIVVVDGDGDTVRLGGSAKRVISLVPSVTDLVVAMSLQSRLVGRTRYDKAPAIASVASVGGTIDPDLEQVFALHPDLVLAWEGTKGTAQRQAIGAHGIPLYAVALRDSAALFKTVKDLGTMLGSDSAAAQMAMALRAQLDSVRSSVSGLPRPTVLFAIWGDPPMTVGPRTFIAELIRIAGGRNIFDDASMDWPRVTVEEIVHRAPDVVILSVGEDSTRGAEALRRAPGWRTLPAVRNGHVVGVPADLTNRPGPLFGVAARAFRDAIHPEARPR